MASTDTTSDLIRPLRQSHAHDASPAHGDAPVSGWRRMFFDWSLVGGATAICHVIGAATSLLLRVFLNPAQMGIWQALKLLLNYGNYANLGISKGAVREFTVARGKDAAGVNAAVRAKHGLNLAFTVNTLTSMVYAVVLVAVGIWLGRVGGGQWSSSWALGMVTVGLLAVLSRYVTFHVTIMRGSQDFAATSRLSVLEGVLTLVVCSASTWLWGLTGLYLGTLVVLLGSLVYVLRHRAVDLRWDWDMAEIRRLIAIGGPILLAGTVASLFRSLDKLMILGYMSDREYQLGCYSVALLVSVQLFGLGNMLSIVMGPRYGEKFGHCGARRPVALMAARATELQAALMALPAALAIVAAAPVLGRLLPKYEPGLAPLVWLVPGALALAISLPAGQYLVAVNRQRRALLVVSIATLIGVVGNHFTLTAGWGLLGVAMATAAAYVFYFVLLLLVSIWPELTPAGRLRYMAMLLVTLVPTMVTALWLEQRWPGAECGWNFLFLKMAAVVLVWSVTVAGVWRIGGWHRVWG
ncbi:MAG: oligosaccharide flippase family protein [Planctomycetota bacterium]|nr:oligosaccharide flippase family protein [Planctomycetota bacterium]